MRTDVKEVCVGMFFVATGVCYGAMAWFGLEIGTPVRMGPGYFPIVLAGLLTLRGFVIAVRGISHVSAYDFGMVPWRSGFFLLAAVLAFAATFEGLGLFPTVLGSSFIACLANPSTRFINALLASIGIAVFCTIVFAYGVKLPVSALGPWLDW